jgi:hypothetical protein
MMCASGKQPMHGSAPHVIGNHSADQMRERVIDATDSDSERNPRAGFEDRLQGDP